MGTSDLSDSGHTSQATMRGSAATPLDRIQQYLRSSGRMNPCRVLLVFSNPLGNATGDTVIATQHARFLPQLARHVEISVWTGDPDIWIYFCPEVTAVAFVDRKALSRDYDVVVFASTPVPEADRAILKEAGVVLIWCSPWRDRVSVVLGSRQSFEALIPAFLNHTTFVPAMYSALGWRRPDRSAPRRPAHSRVVFFNPYASRGSKSLAPRFCEVLLTELAEAIPPRISVIAPRRPRAASREDDLVWDRLAAVVAASRPRAQVLPLSRTGYFEQIARSRLVVGADTSSQHAAAALGVPSIACYPAGADDWYLSWGPVTTTSFHFTVPKAGTIDAQRSLSQLIAELVRRLLGLSNRAAPPRMGNASESLFEHARLVSRECREYLRGRTSSRRAAAAALRGLERAVRPDWSGYVVGELRDLYGDLLVLRHHCSAADRRIALARLAHLNALRVARILGAPSSNAQRTPSTTSTVNWSSRS
jgi:hypothetical protein